MKICQYLCKVCSNRLSSLSPVYSDLFAFAEWVRFPRFVQGVAETLSLETLSSDEVDEGNMLWSHHPKLRILFIDGRLLLVFVVADKKKPVIVRALC